MGEFQIDKGSEDYRRGYDSHLQKNVTEITPRSNPNYLAGAIAGSYERHKQELWCKPRLETRRLEDLGTMLVFEPSK